MDLLAFERKLDQTIARKRMEIQDAIKKPLTVSTCRFFVGINKNADIRRNKERRRFAVSISCVGNKCKCLQQYLNEALMIVLHLVPRFLTN